MRCSRKIATNLHFVRVTYNLKNRCTQWQPAAKLNKRCATRLVTIGKLPLKFGHWMCFHALVFLQKSFWVQNILNSGRNSGRHWTSVDATVSFVKSSPSIAIHKTIYFLSGWDAWAVQGVNINLTVIYVLNVIINVVGYLFFSSICSQKISSTAIIVFQKWQSCSWIDFVSDGQYFHFKQ
jgi:hypothetical protein